jgi:hypothetical protein
LLLLNLTGANWVATGDAERTQDRQTDRKFGPGIFMKTVNSVRVKKAISTEDSNH